MAELGRGDVWVLMYDDKEMGEGNYDSIFNYNVVNNGNDIRVC